ncbi:GntR family transcriptional regulator [Blastococcus sp. LR1]|uniref:GntR family transcriptional regulator n=1 Tax=Blastococcus sp. LR1 TaxID=2877000 RepID=UPI001CC957EC|nr:GntR family transcriptional regulator [Blastococcus sp. LR1]MCA0144051.1 GntR family transcriptional regulator [Blastococcus sp. LR1]
MEDGALLTETVLRRLREEVLDGSLPPGAALSVPALAARLEVSRSPVREAVQQLIHEGLAVSTPRSGARVATIDDSTMRSLLAVREVLDGLAAREAVGHATAADIGVLRGMLAEQERLLDADVEARRDAELDLAFHSLVRHLARNVPLATTLHRLHVQGHLYRSATWDHAEDRRFAVAEHRRIVDAVEAGDAAGAEVAARTHVAAVCVRLMRRPG